MLGVGTTTVVSHAAGRKDREDAQHLFNQSQVLSMRRGCRSSSSPAWPAACATRARWAPTPRRRRLASQYLQVVHPGDGAPVPVLVDGRVAPRHAGTSSRGWSWLAATVLINMVLAPFLIFGWVTGRAYGVAGAAMSTLISIVIGIVWMATYFTSKDAFLHFSFSHWRPHLGQWKRMLSIGLPAGFEFAMMALYQFIVYTVARPFGAASQAGFGIGMRVIQAGFMPVVALGFSVAPVAGQNFGAQARRAGEGHVQGRRALALAWQIFFIDRGAARRGGNGPGVLEGPGCNRGW